MATDKDGALTPAQSLDSLARLAFDPEAARDERDFRQAELLQSVLAIARVDHVFESELVRDVVKAALGHVPEVEE
jgi:hypothetical protein